VAFNSAFNVENVTLTAFLEDQGAQQAAIDATAESMPGVLPEQVSIANVTDSPGNSGNSNAGGGNNGGGNNNQRMLADDDGGGGGSASGAAAGILIDFRVETTTEQLADYCGNCSQPAAAFQYLSTALSTAVNDGGYTTALRTASITLNATATLTAAAEKNSTATFAYSSWVTTPSPSAQPSAVNIAGVASAVVESEFAPLIGSLAAAVVVIAGVVLYFKPHLRAQLGSTVRESLSKGMELKGLSGEYAGGSSSSSSSSAKDRLEVLNAVVERGVCNPMCHHMDVESPVHREFLKNASLAEA
jgi:hypothetical protein